jgi:hypothetical protein
VPNSLAHLGVQALLTRSVIREADEKWIYIGAILPDVGWILHRVLQAGAPASDPYELRLYAVAQTSLFVTLLLAGGLSLLTRRWHLTFAILSLNAVIHLLLDAIEIKWGNGVVLFAPFDWKDRNWGQFWPEAWPAQLLTLLGLGYFLATLRRTIRMPLGLYWPGGPRVLLAAGLISAYVAFPWFVREAPLAANAHYIRDLRHPDGRTGAYVEFDRGEFHPRDSGDGKLEFFASPPVAVVGVELTRPATVSIRGRFTDPVTVEVLDHHEHRGISRDVPTVLALAMVLALVTTGFMRDWRRSRQRT